MPAIQLSQLLHHLLNLLKRLGIIGDKHSSWKLGIRQVSFLQNFVRKCLSLIIGRFRNRNLNQISESSESRLSMPCDKANHHYNVDCFSRLPISFFSRWQRSQSLPLHHHYHPDPQTHPPTSQVVIPYSTTPIARDPMNMSPLTSSSVTTRAEDACDCDPPGLSIEMSDFRLVGVTSSEFERYERNFTSYVLTTDHQL